jgi:enediyne core biosynthesis thioesterase
MTPAYVHRHTVSFEETNLVGNVYFTHYLRWQGHCREAFLTEHAGEVVDALAERRISLVTVSCALDFFGECFAGDIVDVSMRLHHVAGNRIEMRFTYERAGSIVATGNQVVACMRRAADGLVPAPVPAQLHAALGAYA